VANASVTITGTPEAPIFNFDIPQGEQGPPGGIAIGSLLTSIHLDTILASGVYRQDDGSKASPALGYPYSNSGGILLVFERIVNTSVQQDWRPQTRPELIFTRTYSSGTWTAWKVHAATRVDTTAGRAIYQWDNVNDREQLIYGDTGKRILNSFIPNAGSGNVLLSRTGQMVTLLLGDFQDTTAGTNIVWTNLIPAGFRPANWVYMPIPSSRVLVIQNGGTVTCGQHSGTVYQGSISWRTDEAWPTTLPGTASGVIPNI
jgi:hypothetical protein